MVGMVGKSDHGKTIVIALESLKRERDVSFVAFVWLLVGKGILLPGS